MDEWNSDSSNNYKLSFTSSYVVVNKRNHEDLDHLCSPQVTVSNMKRKEIVKIPSMSRSTATNVIKKIGEVEPFINNQDTNVISTEPYCHVKLNSIIELKNSTKKLLCLLQNIQSKTRPKDILPWTSKIKTEADKNACILSGAKVVDSVTDICATALKRLQTQTQLLQKIPTADEDDDCSIFKRLTRKCNCLNQQEYNDLIIHFNENTKYYTTTTGEIIKNLRILKKFLYMGGGYSKHALMFLNEGLESCSHTEKVEITQGCAHADICNVFEDISIVISCIAWPFKYETYGDSVTQELAAAFLYKLAQFEEGRRYLHYTSKVSNDIKKVLKKKRAGLNFRTLESLQGTMDALDPFATENYETINCMPEHEGYGSKTIRELTYFRKYMTLNEIYTHLDLLHKFSTEENGKLELTKCLRSVVTLFQDMLQSYDDSRMNIIITNILNNIVSNNLLDQDNNTPRMLLVAHTATEPIRMKSECNQISPVKKYRTYKKNSKRTKSYVKSLSYNATSRQNAKGYSSNIIIVPKEN